MSVWKLALVTNWADFTTLRHHEHIDMLTRSDLLTTDKHGCPDLDAIEMWIEAQRYPVQLHCQDCGAIGTFIADPDEDGEPDDQCFAMWHLDERMRPFIEDHAPCRYQLRLAL